MTEIVKFEDLQDRIIFQNAKTVSQYQDPFKSQG